VKFLSAGESTDQAYTKELRELLEAEWGVFGSFEQQDFGLKAPFPIVAVEGDTLLGGLVFSLWQDPATKVAAIWINGLFVKPKYRNKGIASSLVRCAMDGQSTLYVLTDVEPLYSSLGWQLLSRGKDGVVLRHQI